MFTCPHCDFPLTGKINRSVDHGTAEVILQCTHCSAILRVEITTLRDPDKERLKNVNTTS